MHFGVISKVTPVRRRENKTPGRLTLVPSISFLYIRLALKMYETTQFSYERRSMVLYSSELTTIVRSRDQRSFITNFTSAWIRPSEGSAIN
jgi:hypothetical protein